MDQQRFDELTRRLSQSRSRRGVLKGLIAGVTGGLIGASTGGVALAKSPTAVRPGRFEGAVIVRWIFCNVEHRRDPRWGFCGDQCIDLDTNNDNCGACGNQCASCEQCGNGQCQSTCDDNNACTTGICDHDTGECRFEPIICNDNDACTIDTCDTVLGCVHTPIVCNDNDPCTIDTCDSVLGCVFTPIDCGFLECQEGSCV